MHIKIEKVKFKFLEITEGGIYKIIEKREAEGLIAIDIIDDSGDIETLTNHDEVVYSII